MKKTTLSIDNKNRITVTKLLKFDETKSFTAKVKENGDIILKPMISINVPAREVWLYKNKEALESVKKGLAQKKRTPLKELL
jgi:hypothetical protein